MRVYFVVLCVGCASAPAPVAERDLAASESRKADAQMLTIGAGPYQKGSTPAEREKAYQDFRESAGTDSARKYGWFDVEAEAQTATLPTYKFDRHPVTQAAYGEFVRATGASPPQIGREDWKAQGFIQHYESEVAHYNWESSRPPRGFEDHPVVLVPWADAQAYCEWRGRVVGQKRRLPTADEFEKAARGPGGSAYPWGNDFDPTKLNSAAGGLRKTSPVGSYPAGRSARGAYDVAGNVFQWTTTPWTKKPGRMTVKGSAWDDHAGLGRAAAAHGRPPGIRHVIVGFRCAADAQGGPPTTSMAQERCPRSDQVLNDLANIEDAVGALNSLSPVPDPNDSTRCTMEVQLGHGSIQWASAALSYGRVEGQWTLLDTSPNFNITMEGGRHHVETLVEETCACASEACLQLVTARAHRFLDRSFTRTLFDLDPSGMQALDTKMTACVQRVRGLGVSSTSADNAHGGGASKGVPEAPAE